MSPRRAVTDLRSFLALLEAEGELRRVRVPVSARYEVAEIVSRVAAAHGPALLFESVEGCSFPIVSNLLASARRIELALGRPPAEIGAELVEVAHRLQPPSLGGLWRSRAVLARAARSRPRRVAHAPCQEFEREPDLASLPILTSWPLDGGPFVTWPMVLTKHPETGGRNLGTYRMQVFDRGTTGMHMQIQKGGGFHHRVAEARGESLPICVVLGGDPVWMLASIAPLPEDIDELAFAAYLRGAPLPVAAARSVPHLVPASAEFILEGELRPGERRMEGPFGDHFGHYSHAAEFPVFHLTRMTHRRDAIYPASVVGLPPQEDRWIGDALQELMVPLARMIHPEVRDLWAFFEAGFHNLLSIAVRERYEKEAMKAALGLLGTGQVSLSKVVITVGPEVNARNALEVLAAVGRHFEPEHDFTLLPGTALDTLDFTSFRMNLGSKMILDAVPKGGRAPRAPIDASRLPDFPRFAPR
ncbi:MAG: UbiD family decarboxylase [Candidatus Eisenbacteria bacterium]